MKAQESRVIGWPALDTGILVGDTTVSKELVNILLGLDVRDYYGIFGSGNAFFSFALNDSEARIFHTRHEGGAAFAATESYFASGRPTAVCVTTGPGLLNALTGIFAAKWDGAKVILISACTNPQNNGRWAIQETSHYTMPMDGLFTSGVIFDYAIQVQDCKELDQIARRLELGLTRPQGFVAHISLPVTMQAAKLRLRRDTTCTQVIETPCCTELVDKCLKTLGKEHFAIWVGFGARHASDEIRYLAEKTGAAVMCTPRAKGIFPETHPQYIGVTGAGGNESVEEYFQYNRPAYTLVLGTRLGEASSFWDQKLLPQKGLIQVDVDKNSLGVAYPCAPVIGVLSEVKSFVRRLAEAIDPVGIQERCVVQSLPKPEKIQYRTSGPIRPQALMQAIQDVIIRRSDALVMSESGNSFSWANHYLRFPSPGRYRTSAEFGSMGHMVTGVVGAALAKDAKAVALVGDGAMHMNNEISTAVKYQAKAVWIVLNDSRYGITFQGVTALGRKPFETELPPTNFVKMAQSLGGAGVRLHKESELVFGLKRAMSSKKPFVVDVMIDRDEISPVIRKRASTVKNQLKN